MVKYEVIKDFSDLQDRGFVYRVGDSFPRKGKKVSDDRFLELASEDNKRKEALIKEVIAKEKKDGVPDEFPIHTGGGHYELSNGVKIQGKEKAIEAEKALTE